MTPWMRSGQCKSCGAAIYWIPMRAPGDRAWKWMPCDRERLVVTVPGETQGEPGKVITGYRSHFATCPNAAAHRRVRKQEEQNR